MATIGGPNTEKDNLVFGYDTGYGVADNNTSTRFYPGEPTTNQADTDAKRNWGTHNGATSSTTTAPEKGPGWKKLIITNINGNNYRLAQFPYLAHADGTTRTYSVEFDVGSLTGYFMFVDGTSGYAQTNVSGKGRYSTTITASGGNKSIAIFLGKSGTHSSINHVIYYKEYQVEEKPHASLFTDSTRSDTASLIDLKRTADIDVSNVSFDSTGQPSFDGTDDRLDNITGVGISNYSSPFSMECVFKVPTDGTWANGYSSNIFSIAGSYAGQYGIYKAGTDTIGFQIRDASTGAYSTATGYAKGVYHHVVATFNGRSGMSFYINGILKSTSTTSFSGAPDSTNLYIGGQRAFGGNVGSWFDGEIPIAKYYNKALSAAEAEQNYNAYKNRFDI